MKVCDIVRMRIKKKTRKWRQNKAKGNKNNEQWL